MYHKKTITKLIAFYDLRPTNGAGSILIVPKPTGDPTIPNALDQLLWWCTCIRL